MNLEGGGGGVTTTMVAGTPHSSRTSLYYIFQILKY